MRQILSVALALALLIGAPQLRAEEPVRDDPSAEVTPRMTGAAEPDAGELRLSQIEAEERTATSDAAAAQFAPRGSFWWVVGVIVVAGVILSVVL